MYIGHYAYLDLMHKLGSVESYADLKRYIDANNEMPWILDAEVK